MSAEAIRSVIERSTASGPHLLALIMIAHESKDRGSYPRSYIGFGALSKRMRLSLRRTKAIVAELIEWGQLLLIDEGGGLETNYYEIPVLKAVGVGVLETAPVVRETPLEHTSRAPSTNTNVVRFDLPCTVDDEFRVTGG